MRQFASHSHALLFALSVLGFVGELDAAVPRGILPQRRGQTFRMPSKPVNIDSSPTIATLNKALKALGETDLDYEGHREKAIARIGAAIQYLETPKARGKSNAAIQKAMTGTHPVATKTATTPQAASDEHLRKAKAILFSVHHQLADHAATRGHFKADAEVRFAIDEIIAALKPVTSAPTAKDGAASTTTTTSIPPGKPAR